MAMQAMAAMESAAILYGALTHPSEKKMSEVMSSVATVMPEMGFDELPTSPVRRELTVTKRKPSTRISTDPRMLILSEGTSEQITTSASDPKREMMPPAATAPAPMYRMYWCQTSSGVMSRISLVAG